ncbi:MAG: aspartyl protease [Moorea sp. SIO2I5]|nr:aspartyl protease [Moorena sp. SIO2I5]
MIQGEFNSRGELFFEVGLMSADGEIFPVMALLYIGFTADLSEYQKLLGYLDYCSLFPVPCSLFPFYINPMFTSQIQTLYDVKGIIEEEEFTVEVLGGNELVNIILGVLWLRTKRLVVDFPRGVLTLG